MSLNKVYLVQDEEYSSQDWELSELDKEEVKVSEQGLEVLIKLHNLQVPERNKVQDYSFVIKDQEFFIIHHQIKGESYEAILIARQQQQQPLFNEYQVVQILDKLLPILSSIHSIGISHQKISLGNIILNNKDQSPVLITKNIIDNILSQKVIENNESDYYKDIQDLAVSMLTLLTGKNRQQLFNKETKTWQWQQFKKLSDQRTEVLNNMLNQSSFQANNILQELHTILPARIPDLPFPVLIRNMVGGIVLLLIVSGVVGSSVSYLLKLPKNSAGNEPNNLPSTSQKFKCPTGVDIIAISCNSNSLAIVTDQDSDTFSGGKLTAIIAENGTSDDSLFIYKNSQDTSNNNNVIYQDVVIGKFTGGNGNTPLEITFNENASTEAVAQIVNSIVYKNTANNLTQSTRTVELTLTDGEGGISETNKTTIGIYPKNALLSIRVPSSQSVQEEKELSISGIEVKDTDAENSILTVSIVVNNGTIAVNRNVPNGVLNRNILNKGSESVISGNLTQINNTLRAERGVIYRSNDDFTGSDTITISVQDTGKSASEVLVYPPNALDSQSSTEKISVTINPDNDDPILNIATQEKEAPTTVATRIETPPIQITTTPQPQPQPQPPGRRNTYTNATVVGEPGTKNIRSGPGTRYKSLRKIPIGSEVRILSESRDQDNFLWYKIYHPSSQTEGWIAAQLIRRD